MKVILKDKTELAINMARISSDDDIVKTRTVLSLDADMAGDRDVNELKALFTKDNISNLTIETKKSSKQYALTTLVDCIYIINDYEEKYDIVLA